MEFTLTFLKMFALGLYLTAPILFSLALGIVLIGQIVGRVEFWNKYDALYWSFITATTVGYGDMRPSGKMSKALSVCIAFIGVMFTGIIVAVSIHAATNALTLHGDVDQIRSQFQQVK